MVIYHLQMYNPWDGRIPMGYYLKKEMAERNAKVYVANFMRIMSKEYEEEPDMEPASYEIWPLEVIE